MAFPDTFTTDRAKGSQLNDALQRCTQGPFHKSLKSQAHGAIKTSDNRACQYHDRGVYCGPWGNTSQLFATGGEKIEPHDTGFLAVAESWPLLHPLLAPEAVLPI